MALTEFELGQHHVGLGALGGTLYGFQVQGGYNRQMQREGARSAEIGGDLDLTTAAVGASRWTQDEFIGGAFQNRATKDRAAFSTCKNLIPQAQGVGAISIPPMILCESFDPLASGFTSHVVSTVPTYVEPKAMYPVAGSIYIAFKHAIFRYQTGSGALDCSNASIPSLGNYAGIADSAYDQNDQIFYALCSPNALVTVPYLQRFQYDFDDPNIGPSRFLMPDADVDGTVFGYGMSVWGPTGDIIVSVGQRLWTFKPPLKMADATETSGTWVDRGRLPGRWVDSTSFNNRLYILCAEADGETHIVCWDGVDILPVTTMPYNFDGWDMAVYGGRLFVVGRGTDVNGGDRYGEMMELTGASIRQVRTFMPEHVEGYGIAPKNFKTVTVCDGLLFFPHQSVGLLAYDLTADGFWGASEFQVAGSLTNFTIHALSRARGGLYGYGSTNGVNTETGLYRVALNTETPASYDSILETADLDYEIGRKKRWSEIVIRARNQTSMTLEYSPDCGYSWTSVSVAATTVGDLTTFRAALAAIPSSETIRFRFTFPQGTDTSLEVMELIAFTVTFLLTDNGKSAWSLTLLGVDQVEDWIGQQEDDNGDNRTQDVVTTFSTIRGWALNKTSLTFKDVDEATYNVTLTDYSEYLPEIGPKIGTRPEGYIRVTLVEV